MVITGDDVAVIAWKGFQKFNQSSYFSLVGCLIIQIVRYLYGQLGRRNAEIYLYVLVEMMSKVSSVVFLKSLFSSIATIFSNSFVSPLKQKEIEYSIIGNVSFEVLPVLS